VISLGSITCPSGRLVVMDGGYLGEWSTEMLNAPAGAGVAVTIDGLPTDRALPVEGVMVDYGPIVGENWESVRVVVGPGAVASSTELGHIVVDWARLAFGDVRALDSWEHDEPVDGLADVAFWGRSQQEMAAAFDAPLLGIPGEDGTHGWRDLTVPEAEAKAEALWAWLNADPDRKAMVDFRPHSHHWQVMAQVRATETGSGVVEVGGARILFMSTGWGDGFFPAYADRDAAGNLVAVRVVLGDDDRKALLEELNS